MRTEYGYIIHKCLNGEPEAFGFLVDRYRASIYAFVYAKIGDFHDAEDLTQEVFINAYQKLGSALPSHLQVIDEGVIPVTTVEITEITYLSSDKGKGDFGQKPKPEPIKAFGGGIWTNKTNTPHRIGGQSNSVVNGKIYVIGGTSVDIGVSARVYEYDPETNNWTRKADMPTGRFGVSTAVVNGMIYAMGGLNNWVKGTKAISSVEAYNPVADTWVKKSEMPTPRTGVSLAVVDGIIYAIGGLDGIKDDMKALSTVEAYDPVTNRWIKKADMLAPRASWTGVGVVDGKIYIIGGTDHIKMPNFATALSTVEMYDPVTDTWTKKADMPAPRSHFSAGVIDGKIFAIGGMDLTKNIVFAKVEMYDPKKDAWTKYADMPTARMNLSISAVNGKIYAFGGEMLPVGQFSVVEEFDPDLPSSVNLSGKLSTTWGEIKVAQ